MRALFRRHIVNITMLLVGLALALSAFALYKQGQSVAEACKIQQRGLVAAPHLIVFFEDWDRLITLQSAQQARVLAKEPPAQRQLSKEAIRQLHIYAQLQSKQPKNRRCP